MHPVQRQSYISSTINIKHRVPLNTDFIVTVEATIDFWHKKVQKIKFFISFPHETRKKHPKIAEISSTALVAQNNKSTRLICAFIVLGIYNFVQRWKNCSEITAWSSINLGVRILFLSNWLGKIDEIGRGYKKSCQSNEGKENKVIKF